MNKLDIITKQFSKEKLPRVKPGDIVRVHTKHQEKGQEKTTIFEGVVISVKGSGINKNITVRKIAVGVGVERIFPIHSPMVAKIEVKRSHKVRRAKLYYLRKITGRASKLKEKAINQDVLDLIKVQEDEEKIQKEKAIKEQKEIQEKVEKEKAAEEIRMDKDKNKDRDTDETQVKKEGKEESDKEQKEANKEKGFTPSLGSRARLESQAEGPQTQTDQKIEDTKASSGAGAQK